MGPTWPLIQRQVEFDAITASLTTRSGGCGVVLTGDPGVGKTTLARFATESLPREVKWVAGTESARSIPLGVFAHLVGASTSRDPVAFLSAARQALLDDGRSREWWSAWTTHTYSISSRRRSSINLRSTGRSTSSRPFATVRPCPTRSRRCGRTVTFCGSNWRRSAGIRASS